MKTFKNFLIAMGTPHKIVISRGRVIVAALAMFACLGTTLAASPFFFTTGNPNGLLGALSRRSNVGLVETETADDFALQETTIITGATITGLIPLGTSVDDIKDLEVEVYHVFPLDSVNPPSGNVPTRANSPADLEIRTATRARSAGTLETEASVLNTSFDVTNTVANSLKVNAGGEGPVTGQEVEIRITFLSPIILTSGHYFFRPEVSLTNGNFLYLSGPRPIPGAPLTPDLQAWIRNGDLAPDWLRIGTDIIGAGNPPNPPAPTFNMSFSLAGETVPEAGTPGQLNCKGQTTFALANQFGGVSEAASGLGFSGVDALQNGIALYCE
jgi:hypothetical protein